MSKLRMADHQTYAEFMMECNPALGIFYEAGTGKTQIALSFAYHALERGEADSVLVVCPASLVSNWESAVDKMLMFEGYTEAGVARLRDALTVVSYQRTYAPRRQGEKLRLRKEVDRHWGIVIVDEAHGLGGHTSVQTRACLTLARLADRRYALTGTPVSGGGGGPDYKKLYGIIRFLHPSIWSSWSEFVSRYVTRMDQFYKPRAYRDAECEALMRDNAIMVRLRDCYDMPAETHDYMDCPLAEPKVYNDLKKGLIASYGIDPDTAGTVYPKMLQLCSGHIITDDGPVRYRTSKDDALRDILDGTDDAVVVFCQFRASVDRCMALARECGRDPVRYDGLSGADDWREFQFGDKDVIVCQYQKGGVGLDLFKSSTMVFFEPCWSFLLLEQAKARIMRTGQTRKCRYIYLRTPATREAHAWEQVRSGLDLTADMFRKWAEEETDSG